MNTIGTNEMNGTHINPIGTAMIVNGTVMVERASGEKATLVPSNPVYLNDRIQTGFNGSVSILLNDGESDLLALGKMTDMVLDSDVVPENALAANFDSVADAEEIQNLLLDDDYDPTIELEAPAAGPAGGVANAGGGTSQVRFNLTAGEVTPESGAETIGIQNEFANLDIRAQEVEVEPVIVEEFTVDAQEEPTVAAVAAPELSPPADPDPVVPEIPTSSLPGEPTAGVYESSVDERGLEEGTGNPIDNPIQTSGTLEQLGISGGPNGLDYVTFTSTLTNNEGDYDPGMSGSVVVQGEYGNLTIFADGTWEYELTDNTTDHSEAGKTGDNDVVTDEFSFTVVDNAGQTVTGGLSVDVYDDGPVVSIDTVTGAQVAVTVEEDGMSLFERGDNDGSEGNKSATEESNSDDEFVSGAAESLHSLFSADVTVGADEPAGTPTIMTSLASDTSELVSLYSNGKLVEYEVDGNTLTGTVDAGATPVFTLTVNDDGSWSFDLDDQLDHVEDGNSEGTLLKTSLNDDVGVDGIDFSSVLQGTVTASDNDGDEASETIGAAAGSFVVKVEDDVPVASADTVIGAKVEATVEEDGMSLLDRGDNDGSEGNKSATEESNSDDEFVSGAAESLHSLFSADVTVGADEPAGTPTIMTSLASDTSELVSLYSNGKLVEYEVDGNTLTGTVDAGATPVFTLTVNDDGSWSFDLDDQLDHVEDGNSEGTLLKTSLNDDVGVDGIDFSSVLQGTVTASDNDGDEASETIGAAAGSFVVKVEDDVPVASADTVIGAKVEATVEEDGMSLLDRGDNDGSEGNKSATEESNSDDEFVSGAAESLHSLFSADVTVGADEPAGTPTIMTSLASDTSELVSLYSNGKLVEYEVDGNTLTGTVDAGATPVFTLTVNDDGSWSFDLDDRLDHVEDGNSEGTFLKTSLNDDVGVDGIDFSSVLQGTVTASDNDGDEASETIGAAAGSFVVKVEDDVPVASADTVIGAKVEATVEEDGMSLLDRGDNDGSEGNKSATEESNSDDEFVSGAAESLHSLFSADVTVGADEPAGTPTIMTSLASDTSELVSLYSNGKLVEYEVDGNTLTGTVDAGATPVFTLTVNDDGSWSFDLDDQLDHVEDGNSEGTLLKTSLNDDVGVDGIDFSSVLQGTVTASDNDGDEASETIGAAAGSFVVKVEDDVPVASADTVIGAKVEATVEEDGMSLLDRGDNDGSEGNKSATEESNSDDEFVSGAAESLHSLFSADVTVGADEPAGTPTIMTSLASDTSELVSLYSNGKLVEYEVDGNTLTGTVDAGATPVFTLTVNDDGSWSFDLDDQLDHVEDGNSEGTLLKTSLNDDVGVDGIDFSSVLQGTVTASDNDGDEASETIGAAAGSFVVKVEDDVPVASADTVIGAKVEATVEEDGMSLLDRGDNDGSEGNKSATEESNSDDEFVSGAAESLHSLFSADVTVGADEPAGTPTIMTSLASDTSELVSLYSNGKLVEYEVDGNTLTGTVDAGATPVFTLTVNDDGSWSFDLDDRLDHVEDGNSEGTFLKTSLNDDVGVDGIDFSSVLQGTVNTMDQDGDVASDTIGAAMGSFVVTVEDDVPESSYNASTYFVSEYAGYNSVVGTYTIDESGNPVFQEIIIESTNTLVGGSQGENEQSLDQLIDPGTKFFLLANGAGPLSQTILTDNSVVEFVKNDAETGWVLQIDGSILVRQANNNQVEVPAYFMDSSMNADGAEHFQDENGNFLNEVPAEGAEIRIEDLPNPGSGSDYNDLVLRVEVGPVVDETDLSDDDPDTPTVFGNLFDGTGGFKIASGADGPGQLHVNANVINVTNTGADYYDPNSSDPTVPLVMDGNGDSSITTHSQVGTLVIYDNGDWEYKLTDNTTIHPDNDPGGGDHTDGDSDHGSGDQVQDLFDIVFSDADGDSVTSQLVVNINDDSPVVTFMANGGTSLSVDEDALGNTVGVEASLNNIDTDLTTGLVDADGSDTDQDRFDLSALVDSASFGADGPASSGSVGFSIVDAFLVDGAEVLKSDGSALKSGDATVQYKVVSGDLIGVTGFNSADETEIFRFSVEQEGDNWYGTFNLQGPVDHTGINDDGEGLTLSGLGEYIEVLLTDGDGDTATSNLGSLELTIDIENDVPKIGSTQDSLLANEIGNSVTGDLGVLPGADGLSGADLGFNSGEAVTATFLDEQSIQQSYTIKSNGDDLQWVKNSEGNWSAVPGGVGQAAFTVVLDSDSGSYTVTQTGAIDGVEEYGGVFGNDNDIVRSEDKSPEMLIIGADYSDVVSNSTTYTDGVFVLAEAFGRTPSESVYVKTSNEGIGVGYISNQGGNGQFLAGNYNDTHVWESQSVSFKFLSEATVVNGEVQDSGSNLLPATSVTVAFNMLGFGETASATLWLDDQLVGAVNFTPSEDLFTGNGQGNALGNSNVEPTYTFTTDDTGGSAFDEIRLAVADPNTSDEVDFDFEADYRIASIEVDSYLEDTDHTITIPFEVVDSDGDTATGEINVTFDSVGDLDATEVYEDQNDPNNPGMAISGSTDSDVIIGTSGNDSIIAEEGDDVIFGGEGDDIIFGGTGGDELYGGGGNDQLIGGDGEDELDGGAGNDILIGDDILFGDTGDPNVIVEDDDLVDTLIGGDGLGDVAGDADSNDDVDDGNNDNINDPDIATVEDYITQDELDALIPPTGDIV
ncbi:retention module-containing protein [Desulfopila sp. IMCC35008]|uniref:retention module-containing protein n=1 Tax=Desulfopila sp. IMCC35008 TaxID=2653858 RepID=UPI002714E5E8|nr:retention module-containing protein [Desulfopila sp. IMCC35008]